MNRSSAVTDDDLQPTAALRETLQAERASAEERAAALAEDLAQVMAASTLVATDDEHDPEGATIAFDRAQLSAVLDQTRRHLADLDEALNRLADGAYGVCTTCHQPIGSGRLEARPAATTCISCASRPDR